ncbi:MAG: AGE family epimerase/isomerase [Lapillicoccus sp.]
MSAATDLTAEERSWLEGQAAGLVDFTRGSVHPDGGFAWLDDDGVPQLERPVELWVTCRMTHVLALAALRGDSGAGDLVGHGVAALRGRLHDDEHGGWYASVETAPDGSSRPVDDTKQSYAHSFVILAAASAVAAGHPDARPLLDDALAVFGDRFWIEGDGLVADVWDRPFSTLDPYRGVNANMHSVEALLAAHDVTGDRVLLERATSIVSRVVHGFAAGNDYRLPEHYDQQWHQLLDYNRDRPADKFRPYGVTIGHLLEWARLALHLRTALGADAPEWLLTDAVALFDRAVADGWDVDGAPGLVYTTDFDATPIVRDRLHWVVAEGLATAWTLALVTGEAGYRTWFDEWRQHINDLFVDRERGSWHHELDSSNHPSSHVWDGKPDTYHAYQAVLLPSLDETTSFVAGVLAQTRPHPV